MGSEKASQRCQWLSALGDHLRQLCLTGKAGIPLVSLQVGLQEVETRLITE